MPLQEELATRLGFMSGYEDYALFLSSSGAEANENALKMASFHTGRSKVLAFHKSFHGRTSLAVAVTDNPSIVAPINQKKDLVFLPLNDEEALLANLDETVCAVIVEGIQGVGGIHVPSPAFLQVCRKRCSEVGAVLILDEVQSGYGRSGHFFAHQHAGIQADIITIAKGMGNGFPIAGTLLGPQFAAKHGLLGTTFGGNYLACAAALAVLEVIEEERLLAKAEELGHYLINQLSQFSNIKEVRGLGLMIGLELEKPAAPLRKRLLEVHGIFTGSSSEANTLRLLPALNVTREQVDLFMEALSLELQPALA
jgi:acetylornithine aminotransferase